MIDTSDLEFEWAITADGTKIVAGKLPGMSVAARSAGTIDLPLSDIFTNDGREYLVTVLARAKANYAPLVPTGHIVGWDQFTLAEARHPKQPELAKGKVTIKQDADLIEIVAGNAVLSVSRRTGLIEALSYGGKEVLAGGAPNFWRAETDNDKMTGTGRQMAPWRTMSSERQLRSVTVLDGGNGPKSVSVTYSLGGGAAYFTNTYALDGNGNLDITSNFKPVKMDLPPPVRIGLAFTMPERFNSMTWYGRGPHETYVDRKRAATTELWHGSLLDQAHDYIRPQDTGNKVDVRWAMINDAKSGVRVSGSRHLMVQALPFPYAMLERKPPGQAKSTDIVPKGRVSLNVDVAQWGVGGDTTWDASGQPHAQYRTQLADTKFSLSFAVVEGEEVRSGTAKPGSASREYTGP